MEDMVDVEDENILTSIFKEAFPGKCVTKIMNCCLFIRESNNNIKHAYQILGNAIPPIVCLSGIATIGLGFGVGPIGYSFKCDKFYYVQ